MAGLKDSIWLHAVSVGEVAAIRPLWKRLRREFPSKRIVISTITKTGNEAAKKFSTGTETVFYLPLDFSFTINSALKNIKPGILIIAETEIWPNLISLCHKRTIPVVLVNGRISDKAFKRYRLARFALKGILKKINAFCVRSQEDSERFASLGAPPEKIEIAGNMKYCNDGVDACNSDLKSIRSEWAIRDDELVLVAGSTHKGEEEIVLEVFRRLTGAIANLRLIIAPRHVDRAAQVRGLAGAAGVTVVDKMGVLKELYSISDVVFVGGSLVRHGGHNIIEPAIFGKAILFGPHMFNFKDVADEFLKNEAAIMVKDKDELESNCKRLLSDKEARIKLGRNAKKVVLQNQGAVENCLSAVRKVLL